MNSIPAAALLAPALWLFPLTLPGQDLPSRRRTPKAPIERITDAGTQQSAKMTYEEKDPGSTPRRSGGLVGGLLFVGDSIAAAGGGSKHASLEVDVLPALQVIGNDRASAVLEIVSVRFHLPDDIEASTKAGIQGERERVLNGLKAWTYALSKKQVEDILSGKAVEVDANEPFATLRILSRPRLTLHLAIEAATVKELKFVPVAPGEEDGTTEADDDLRYDALYTLQVVFDKRPLRSERSVAVSFDRESVTTITVYRSAAPEIMESKPIQFQPAYRVTEQSD